MYFKNRFLRIYPGLWVCLAVSLLTVILTGYINRVSLNSFLIWLTAQLTFFQFYNHHIFSDYATGILNGSLWTISVELQFYFFVPLFYTLTRKYNPSLKFYFILFVASALLKQLHNVLYLSAPSSNFTILLSVSLPTYLFYFFIGMLLQHQRWIIKNWIQDKFHCYLIVLLTWTLIAKQLHLPVEDNHLNVISGTLLALSVFAFAYSNMAWNKFIKGTDISYGIYIYHMIVITFLYQ